MSAEPKLKATRPHGSVATTEAQVVLRLRSGWFSLDFARDGEFIEPEGW